MRSPSSTQWTPNKKSLQPMFNILLSFHTRGFVLVGKKSNGVVPQRVACRTCNLVVAGSTPRRGVACVTTPGKVVHTSVPLSPRSTIWYGAKGGWEGNGAPGGKQRQPPKPVAVSSKRQRQLTWYSATYNPEQRRFTTSEVAAEPDWHWL